MWVLGFKEYQGIPAADAHGEHRLGSGLNVDYRLSPRATFPEHLIDVKRALVWIASTADELRGRPRLHRRHGGSAGGHLAALVGLTAGDPEHQLVFESADTRVQGVVAFYAVYDMTNRLGTRTGRYRGRSSAWC